MKKRYNKEEREKTVLEFQASGLERKIFAKQEGISTNTLGNWINGKQGNINKSPKFIKVAIPESDKKISEVKIHFKEFQIIMDDNTNDDLLLRALRGVRSLC